MSEAPTKRLEAASERIADRYSAAGARPSTVCRPASVGEVAEVVRDAAAEQRSVIAAGRGRRLSVGGRPRSYDVALLSERMAGIVEHRAEDMTVTVGAGMSLTDLDGELAAHGQYLPFDPAALEDTTVGGLVACDANGPLRHSAGKVRDYLLGVEMVNGKGEVVRAGGKVVKNVAGYDVAKLVVGSFGSLAVLTEATFKTRPRPQVEAALRWGCADLASAVHEASTLEGEGVAAAYLEVFSEELCRTLGVDARAGVVVGLHGSSADVVEQCALVSAVTAGRAIQWSDDDLPAAVRSLRNFPEQRGDDEVAARVVVPASRLAELLARAAGEARNRGVGFEVAAHAGVGVVRCCMNDSGNAGQLVLFAEWLRLAARERRGSLVYESIPEQYAGKLDPWGYVGPTLPLMRGIKQVFDPQGVLSPGRFVGGL